MNTIAQCAVHLTNGAVLQAESVSASRDRLIDWRAVKSGAAMLENADAFDVAALFVAIVGDDAAMRAVCKITLTEPTPEVYHFAVTANGGRRRTFEAQGFSVYVEPSENDAEQAQFTTALARAAALIDL